MPLYKVSIPLSIVEVDHAKQPVGDEASFAQTFFIDGPSALYAADVFCVRLSDLIARHQQQPAKPAENSWLRTVFDRSLAEGLEIFPITGGWAIRRPNNFESLSPEEQWRIDKALGILDR